MWWCLCLLLNTGFTVSEQTMSAAQFLISSFESLFYPLQRLHRTTFFAFLRIAFNLQIMELETQILLFRMDGVAAHWILPFCVE